jgi:ADP-ribose pyrophosphatase YjhB (NUDIX family)
MTLGARAIALDDEQRVMLVRHTYKAGWYLPGGGVERLEIAEEAARRELAEEAGLAADGPMSLFGVYANHANFKNDHVLVFRAGPVRPCPPDSAGEIAERRFFAYAALPDGVTPGTRRRLEELFEGAPKSPTW